MDCPHFGVCGGCVVDGARPAPYEQQLLSKETLVRGLLKDFTVQEWRPIVPAPQIWQYRNKMEYAFSFGWDAEGDVVLGLREAGKFDRVVDLETCHLVSPELAEALRRTRAWARRHGLKGYHRKRHVGDLRYLVLREGKNTDQRMAVLIASHDLNNSSFPAGFGGEPINISEMSMVPLPLAAGDDTKKATPYLPALKEALSPLITSAWLGVTDSRGDVARADDMRLLWGSETIDETLNGITYRISPFSFFQTNTKATEKLYALLAEWAVPVGGALLDLYCGGGGISLAVAKGFERVIGVDTNREAIEDAKANAARNGITNVEFVCEDALEFLKKLPASKMAVQLSALIVDPPRAGLHPKALTALIEMNPPELAYVSCNPESLARDLRALVPLYHITSVQPVDLFPNTAHVETLCLMRHR